MVRVQAADEADMRAGVTLLADARRRSASFDAVMLHEIVYPAGFRIGWHTHERAGFSITLRGSSTEGFTGTRFDHTENGVILRPAGERHWDIIGDHGAKCFLIEVSPQCLDALPRLRAVLDRPRFHALGGLSMLAQRAYGEWLLNDSASKVAIPALVMEMTASLIRESDQAEARCPPAWLSRVRDRLHDNYADTPSLKELAGIGGVHATHLARHFRRHYGLSIGEYLRKRRVDAAIEMLAQPDQSLTQIALATGFAHHAHFTTTFKRFTGLTPSDFRRLRR
jgi:AraC family transcriptional regulator